MTGEEYLPETVAMMQEEIVTEHFIVNKIIERSQCLSEACSEGRDLGPQGRHGRAGEGDEM